MNWKVITHRRIVKEVMRGKIDKLEAFYNAVAAMTKEAGEAQFATIYAFKLKHELSKIDPHWNKKEVK